MSFYNFENIFLFINGRKVSNSLAFIKEFSEKLPHEAGCLFISQLNLNIVPQRENNLQDLRVKISEAMSAVTESASVKGKSGAFLRPEPGKLVN
jgi:hypothetical protein